MGLGPVVYLVWFGVVFASLVVAGIHFGKHKLRGIGPALASVIGAFLSWAFVSAYIGVCEIAGYARSGGFAASLAIGFVGVALLAFSCFRLTSSAQVPDQRR